MSLPITNKTVWRTSDLQSLVARVYTAVNDLDFRHADHRMARSGFSQTRSEARRPHQVYVCCSKHETHSAQAETTGSFSMKLNLVLPCDGSINALRLAIELANCLREGSTDDLRVEAHLMRLLSWARGFHITKRRPRNERRYYQRKGAHDHE